MISLINDENYPPQISRESETVIYHRYQNELVTFSLVCEMKSTLSWWINENTRKNHNLVERTTEGSGNFKHFLAVWEKKNIKIEILIMETISEEDEIEGKFFLSQPSSNDLTWSREWVVVGWRRKRPTFPSAKRAYIIPTEMFLRFYLQSKHQRNERTTFFLLFCVRVII